MNKAFERDLINAMGRNEFSLVYQLQIDLAAGVVCGAEALVRWHHPERGTVPPDRFVHVAEELGLIVPLGDLAHRVPASGCRGQA